LPSGGLAGEKHQARAVPDERIGVIGIRGEGILTELHASGKTRAVPTEAGEEVGADRVVEAASRRGGGLGL
jgi:hypothetical protein